MSNFANEPGLARILRKIDRGIGLAEQVALVALGLFLIVVCLLWLATEHLADKPLENASADIRYGVYLMAMIGGAFAAHHRRLLSMDVINRMVSGKIRAWLRVATTLFAMVITAAFFWYSYELYKQLAAEPATAEHWMPAIVAKAAMPIGAGMLLVHFTLQVLIDLAYLLTGKIPPEPEMGAA